MERYMLLKWDYNEDNGNNYLIVTGEYTKDELIELKSNTPPDFRDEFIIVPFFDLNADLSNLK